MNRNNEKIDSNRPKSIISFSRGMLIIIAILIYIIAILLDVFLKINIKDSVVNVITTIASTCLAIGIINIFYEQWKDKQLMKSISDIPISVKNQIQGLIGEIALEVSSTYDPAVSFKVYRQSENAERDLSDDLIAALKESRKLYYTGIGMSVVEPCIHIAYADCMKKRLELNFAIPHPNSPNLSPSDKEQMISSIKNIVNNCMQQKHITFTLKFAFLSYIPPFHVHLTDHRCWFAFVDKGRARVNGINEEITGQKRVKYPTTYAYKHDGNKDNDIIEMYATINNIVEELLDRHKNSTYTLVFGGGTPFAIEWGGHKAIPDIDEIFSEFYKYQRND